MYQHIQMYLCIQALRLTQAQKSSKEQVKLHPWGVHFKQIFGVFLNLELYFYSTVTDLAKFRGLSGLSPSLVVIL